MSNNKHDTHSSRVRAAMGSTNRLKLGLFGANCSSGRAITMVPERWSGSWPDCVRLAQAADQAGIEFMLPIGRWKGYGGVLYDDNAISIDGPTALAFSDDPLSRFRGYGWAAERIDGHDNQAVADAIGRAQQNDRPSLIACRTTIAFGAPTKAGTAAAHGAPLGAAEIAEARERLGWSDPPFVIPEDVRAEWRAAGSRGTPIRSAWETRLQALPADRRAEFLRRQHNKLPHGLDAAIVKLCDDFRKANAKVATRQASGTVLDTLTKVVPELVGGSADLTPSNNTKAKDQKDVRRGDFAGHYLRYGVREHGMAAAMNGIAVHRGLIPYGGTFLTFSDYARPAIRLAAFMGIGVIYVMTHDSIGLGEDGPTHQPVEHLAALRAMPGLCVYRQPTRSRPPNAGL